MTKLAGSRARAFEVTPDVGGDRVVCVEVGSGVVPDELAPLHSSGTQVTLHVPAPPPSASASVREYLSRFHLSPSAPVLTVGEVDGS